MFEKTGYCRATTTRLCGYKKKRCLMRAALNVKKATSTRTNAKCVSVTGYFGCICPSISKDIWVCCPSLSMRGRVLCSSMETHMIVRKTRSCWHFKLICHILSPTLCCCSYYSPCYSLMDPLSRVYAPTAFRIHCFFHSDLCNSNPKEMNNYSNT